MGPLTATQRAGTVSASPIGLAATLLAAAATLAVLAAGCGTSCPAIADDLQAFDRALDPAPDGGALREGAPNARLSLPLDVLNPEARRLLADRIGRRVPMPALPGQGGVPVALDGLAWSLRDLRLVAMDDALAAELDLALLDGAGPLLDVTVTTRIQPAFLHGPQRHIDTARLRVTPRDVARVTPTLPPGAADRLGTWIEAQLPSMVRGAIDRAALRDLGNALLPLLVDLAWPSVRDELLGDAPLLDLDIALPPWPIRGARLGTWPAGGGSGGGVHLLLWGETGPEADTNARLPAARPVISPTLALHGALAMRLVATAQRSRALPARYAENGAADDAAPWHARTTWHGGARPFGLRLWRLDDACRRVDLDAELGLALEGGQIAVAVREARVAAVLGPGFLEAFAWAERLFGDAMNLTIRQPSELEVAVGGTPRRLRVDGLRLDGDVITAVLALVDAR
jgi:hypothetical protein